VCLCGVCVCVVCVCVFVVVVCVCVYVCGVCMRVWFVCVWVCVVFVVCVCVCVCGCHVESIVVWIVTPFHTGHGISNAQYFNSCVILISGQTFFVSNQDSLSGNIVFDFSLTL